MNNWGKENRCVDDHLSYTNHIYASACEKNGRFFHFTQIKYVALEKQSFLFALNNDSRYLFVREKRKIANAEKHFESSAPKVKKMRGTKMSECTTSQVEHVPKTAKEILRGAALLHLLLYGW